MTTPMTNERIDQALDFVLQTANDTKGFVLEQAPLVAREIVAWTLWGGVFKASLCLIVAVSLAKLVRKEFAAIQMKGVSCDRQSGAAIILALAVPAMMIFTYGLAIETGNVIKSLVAPRLVIIDTLRSAAK